MSELELYDRLSGLSRRLDRGVCLLELISECMERGLYSVEAYTPAVRAAREYLAGVDEGLQGLITAQQTELSVSREGVR